MSGISGAAQGASPRFFPMACSGLPVQYQKSQAITSLSTGLKFTPDALMKAQFLSISPIPKNSIAFTISHLKL